MQLARQGYDVGITWHEDEDGANETASEVQALNRRAVVRRLDLTELPGPEAVVDELMDELGGIDAFVNNSGVGRSDEFLDLDWDEWLHVLNVNLNGAPMTGNEDVDPRRVERDSIPMGRPGDAREIASMIAWLCCDGAQYATGSSFVVDGGLLLMAAVREE